jgi:ribonuclease HII
MVEPSELDRVGMAEAVRLSFLRAASSLNVTTDLFIIDGLPVRGLGIPAEFVVRGDSRSLSVAAAGIVAKVTRDRIMIEADALYPGYGFSTNMGYGTREHMTALGTLGPCPIHRRSFSPLRDEDQLRLPLE